MFLLDLRLLILVISFFINDLFSFIFLIMDKIYIFLNLNDVMCFMGNNTSNTVNTQIIHDDGSISNSIRSFLYMDQVVFDYD